MEAAPYLEALEAATPDRDAEATLLEAGLINKTYKVEVGHKAINFLLQQINKQVFPEPEKLQDNYEKIWSHLQYNQLMDASYPISIPAPLPFTDDRFLFRDSRGRYWRMFEFIDHTKTIDSPESPEQAREVAQTFAAFTKGFESFEPDLLHTTIPGFHDLGLRYRQFKTAMHSRDFERLQKAAPVIDQLKKREHYASFFEIMTGSDEFEKRVMHNDAKISNTLFQEDSGKLICPVDFDTCMPGYFFSDLGDMIRSMAGTEKESSVGYSNIDIRKEYYDAILFGYLEIMGPFLTAAEKKYIHHAGLLMTYMQALRFMTDFLSGDSYYYTTYPGQNFDRSRNQLVLLEKLEAFLQQHYPVHHE